MKFYSCLMQDFLFFSIKMGMPNIFLLKSRDESEFKKLFDLQAPKVLNMAFYILGNRQDAEDVTQEVFKSVFLGIENFKEEAGLHTWIYRITLNKCNEFLRKKNRMKRRGILLNLWDASHLSNNETPEILHILKEEEQRLWQSIQILPENQKTALVLFSMNDLSYHEIAAAMNLSHASVESLLFRARTTLKKNKYGK